MANLDDLNLAAAGVELDEKGFIKTAPSLQTNVPNIYAVGDVRGGELFTYTSLDDFRIVFSQIFGDKKTHHTKQKYPRKRAIYRHATSKSWRERKRG